MLILLAVVLILLAVVLVVVVVLAAIAVPVDRACAALAERRAAAFMTARFDSPATVRAHGRPFLSQAIRGRYSDVEVAGGGLRIGEMTGATLSARLRNAHLPLRELLAGRTTELPCEHVEGVVVLPYGELARVARIPGLELHLEDGKLLASAAVPIPGISQLARVSGEAVLTLNASRTVWLRVRGVSVVGINLPAIVLNQLLPALERADPAAGAALRVALGRTASDRRRPRGVRLRRRRRVPPHRCATPSRPLGRASRLVSTACTAGVNGRVAGAARRRLPSPVWASCSVREARW